MCTSIRQIPGQPRQSLIKHFILAIPCDIGERLYQ